MKVKTGLFLLVLALSNVAQAWVLRNEKDPPRAGDLEDRGIDETFNQTEVSEEILVNTKSHPGGSEKLDHAEKDEEFNEMLDRAETYIGEIGESTDSIEAMIKSIKLAELNKQTTAKVPDLFLSYGEQDKIDVEDMYDVVTDFLEETLDKTEEVQSEIDEALEDLNSTTANLLPRNEILISLRSVQTSLAGQAKTLTSLFRQVDAMRDNQDGLEYDSHVTDYLEDEVETDEENFLSVDTDELTDGTDEFSLVYMGVEDDDSDDTDNTDDDNEDDITSVHKSSNIDTLPIVEKTKHNELELDEMLPFAESVNETSATTVATRVGKKSQIFDWDFPDTSDLVSNNEQEMLENGEFESTLDSDQLLREITSILESSFVENEGSENENMATNNFDSTNNLKLNLLDKKNTIPNSELNDSWITVDEPEAYTYDDYSDISTPYPVYEVTTVSEEYEGDELAATSFEMYGNMPTIDSKLYEETTQPDEMIEHIDEVTTAVPSVVDQNFSIDNSVNGEYHSMDKFLGFFRDKDTLYPPDSNTGENQNIDFMFPDTQNENNFVDTENLKDDMTEEDNEDFDTPVFKSKETEVSHLLGESPLDMADNFDSMNEQYFLNAFDLMTDDQSDDQSDEEWETVNNDKLAQLASNFDPYAFLNKINVKFSDEDDSTDLLPSDDDDDIIIENTNDIFPVNKPDNFESMFTLDDSAEDNNPKKRPLVVEEWTNQNTYSNDVNEDIAWDKPVLDEDQIIIKDQVQSFGLQNDMLDLINKQKIEDDKVRIDDNRLNQQSVLLWFTAGVCLVGVGVLVLFMSVYIGLKRKQQLRSKNCSQVPYTVMEDEYDKGFGRLSFSKPVDEKKVYSIQV